MTAIIFIFGLIIGSFLNCLIYRLEMGQVRQLADLSGRSYCPHCKHKLGFYDLIPILSFIWLGGKCHYCHKKISLQYPLVELATGILFVLNFWRSDFPHIWREVGSLAIIPFLIVIFVYDLKHYLIPDKVIYPAIIIALIFNFFKSDFLALTPGVFSSTPGVLGKSGFLLSALGAAAFFGGLVLISRGKWMGAGDISLAFLMGLLLGWPNILVALFFAFFSGAIIGVGLIFYGKKKLKSEIPFGPFLVAGTFVALFLGEKLVNWYLNFYV